jgi:AcrR family transcriptional regulator
MAQGKAMGMTQKIKSKAGLKTAPRTRLSPQASRAAALAAARDILVEEGPQAVTLKAVAARIGRTHANLLHHFGSAADLQRALAASIAEAVVGTIRNDVLGARRGESHPRAIVDDTFNAFGKGGAGALASWMILSGNRDALDPILTAIHDLVTELDDVEHQTVRGMTLSLVLMALGDALLGDSLCEALEVPRDAARELALQQLLKVYAVDQPTDMLVLKDATALV